ncbi:MAG: Mrp/NBP35 family ATP-binding protein [Endomicrobiales bacterium]|nr:Mrp/NBP35 family ATP-binding protein [Endomicrobiales bacterium]
METQTAREKELDQRLQSNLSRIKNKLMIFSGKGGVGKTTAAVNIACGLANRGYKVGILDVDVHGPNIAKMLGLEGQRLAGSELGMEPMEALPNLKAVSLALIMENQDQPIIWRGPMKMGVIRQFLSEVNWGPLDYLIIDSPPGTGDEPLSVCQLIQKIDGGIVVTTPQDVAILDARKSISFAKELNIRFTGVIENMSGFICPHCNKEIDLFGSGGGEKAANDMGVEFLGRIPLEPEMVKLGDSGRPIINSKREDKTSRIIENIIDRILNSLNGKK